MRPIEEVDKETEYGFPNNTNVRLHGPQGADNFGVESLQGAAVVGLQRVSAVAGASLATFEDDHGDGELEGWRIDPRRCCRERQFVGTDGITDQLGKYASPQVVVDIVVHEHDDGNRYLAFHVHQFRDCPVVCRNNSSDDVKPKDRLSAGDIYVRPTSGKPRTEKVTDASRLHDLLELAADFRARKMVEIGKRIGLVPGETAASRYDAELASISESPSRRKGKQQ